MEFPPIENRLSAIENRLSKIERSLGFVESKTATSPTPKTNPAISAQQKIVENTEQKSGNWLGMIAVICFVLAAGFIVKLSIESGWLTPVRQVAIAIILGFGLIGAGFKFFQSDKEYASLLPSAGIIVLYITIIASHRYYGIIGFDMAIAAIGLVSGLCIWLYTKIRHDIYPIIAAVGAYVAPFIVGINAASTFSMYYFLLCSVAFAVISVFVKSRVLTLISAYLAVLMSGVIGKDLLQDRLVVGILALQFLVFSVGTYLYSIQNKSPLTETEANSFLPILLIFYAMEYSFIERIDSGLAPWVSLTFAALLIGLYLSARKFFPDGLGSKSLILSFVTIIFFHSVYLELLPVDIKPWLFVIILLGINLFSSKIPSKGLGSSFFIPSLAIFGILAIEYVTMLFRLIDGSSPYWLFVSFASFAAIWTLLIFPQNKFIKNNNYGNGLLAAAHLLAVIGFYRLGYDIGSLAVSALWLFYGVGVIVFAFIRKDEVMAKSAMFVLAFAAGKALLYDAASAPTIIRIFCLLLTGIVLYYSGFLMRKINAWQKQ